MRGISRSCFQCGKLLLVSRWDDWNGFLIRCPHCGRYHGKNWNLKAILWGSFFFHAFSFFFTMRPLSASICVVVLLLIGLGGNQVIDRDWFPQWLEFVAVVGFLFTPLLINAGMIINHETSLGLSGKDNM
jgi:hypothetical protein